MKHDNKYLKEIIKYSDVNGLVSIEFLKQYAEHMVQQERERIQKIGEDILNTEMEYYGTDKHGLSREQFIKAINK